MKLFYDLKKRTLIQKIKYILRHPSHIRYWLKEVSLGVKNVFRKNSARMIISLCTVILGILFVISIFFYNLGKFVITVDPKLTDDGFVLSDDKSFENEKYKLFGKAIKNCDNISINDIPLDVNMQDGQHNGKNYIAYTFYIKNAGKNTLSYKYNVDIKKSTKNIEKATWFLIYYNDEPQIYALERSDQSPERQYSTSRYPMVDAFDSLQENLHQLTESNKGLLNDEDKNRLGITDYEGINELVANPFESDTKVVQKTRKNIDAGDIDKFTIVIWLEGEDPECIDDIKGGSIEVSMKFDKIDNDDSDNDNSNN